MIVKNTGNKVTEMPVDYFFPLLQNTAEPAGMCVDSCLDAWNLTDTVTPFFFFFPFLTPHLQQQYAFRHVVLLWIQKIAPISNQLRSSFTSCIVLYFASFDFVVLRGLASSQVQSALSQWHALEEYAWSKVSMVQ